MLQAQAAPAPEAIRTRLIVEPPRAVRQSVLPAEDDQRAEAEAAGAGIPPALLRHFGATIRQTHERARVVVIDVPADRQAALVEALAAIGIPARPPNPVQPMLNESVPLLKILAVWRAGFDGSGIRVAIVDTGIDAAHPDFIGRVAAHSDFSGVGNTDDVGHGTHVAGIVAGGGAVYRGVAPRATLVIAKALSVSGGTEDAVLAALSWASRQRIDVVNLSLGGPGDPHDPLSREVDALTAEGILVCVAAGNSGPAAGTIGSPGCAAGAITVGATDKERRVAEYSSRGPVPGLLSRKPDVVAIGGGVTPQAACHYGIGVSSARAAVLVRDRCAVPPRYVRMSGTSMAAPHVAGLCALLLEASRAKSPRLVPVARAAAVRAALIQGAVELGLAPEDAGAGIADGARALAALGFRRSALEPASSSSSPAMASSGIQQK